MLTSALRLRQRVHKPIRTNMKWLFGERKASTGVNTQAIQDTIKETTSTHQVVIYSKTYCPYCTSTKQFFNQQFPNADTKVIELNNISNGDAIQSMLAQMTGQRTVPSVWVRGQFLGGNDDTQALFRTGKLSELMK
mmetsp:Transcript_5780/g.7118  ORF Transcript_5780/g.7118 Transcript_5780/m.7118 type:complete len:136 (-) Transcript_5780:211-618(-)